MTDSCGWVTQRAVDHHGGSSLAAGPPLRCREGARAALQKLSL